MGDIMKVRESREAHLKTEKDGDGEAKVRFANMEVPITEALETQHTQC